ncbi:MAG: antitoxin VbhA family protein [Clostridia bacterium]|nr:antitoxin VbhA family protein [Clostridia bacterium]
MYKVSNDDIINILDNAIASVEMEGFVFSDGERELCMAALEGKITKDDFIELLLKKCKI